MSDQTTKLLRVRTSSSKPVQLVPYWPDNAEPWFSYAKADLLAQEVVEPRLKFLAVIRSLPRELNRHVTATMFSEVADDPYFLVKTAILKQSGLTDRQRLDELFRNIELGSSSAVDILRRMRGVVGQLTFDQGLFRQLFLPRLPQTDQAVLVSLHNNPVEELAESADCAL